MSTIFHITPQTQWEKALTLGTYKPDGFASEGFIHAAKPRQLAGVVDRYYQGQKSLVLLEIQEELVKPKVIYEGADDKFPHIYGELNLDSIVAVHPFDNYTMPPRTAIVSDTYIRPARPIDAGELANCHLNSWREIYKGIVPQDYLDKLPLSFLRRQNSWREQISNGTGQIFVAESDQHGVVGFVNAGEPRDAEYSSYGEIRAIYLLAAYKNLGIGRTLLQMAFKYLCEKGLKKAYCWVLENNPTIEFYEKSGGKLGSHPKTVTIGIELREFICEWNDLK